MRILYPENPEFVWDPSKFKYNRSFYETLNIQHDIVWDNQMTQTQDSNLQPVLSQFPKRAQMPNVY